MNGFDWIVTVAMGSLVASPILLKGDGILDVKAFEERRLANPRTTSPVEIHPSPLEFL